MEEWDCLECGEENQFKGSFGDDETCKDCGTVHETDWDYIDYGSIATWITAIKSR